jgi:hypothetical protein
VGGYICNVITLLKRFYNVFLLDVNERTLFVVVVVVVVVVANLTVSLESNLLESSKTYLLW